MVKCEEFCGVFVAAVLSHKAFTNDISDKRIVLPATEVRLGLGFASFTVCTIRIDNR